MSNDSPVARDAVFVLNDGHFALRRGEDRVQELVSGRYRRYAASDYGEAVSDYELDQLVAAGRVERYSSAQVWLGNLPNAHSHLQANYAGSVRMRTFYLNTSLPRTRLDEVQVQLQRLEPEVSFIVRVHGDMVAILGKNGGPFPQLKDAERMQKYLQAKLPELFRHTAIAFYETSDQEPRTKAQEGVDVAPLGSGGGAVTRGKQVLVLMRNAAERQALHDMLCDMDMNVILADSGIKGLQLLEDMKLDLLLMDVQLPDMHGWELLAKIKEIGSFQALPKIVLADHHSKSDDQAFALTVGKVDLYLPRPISLAQLRRNIWTTLKHALD